MNASFGADFGGVRIHVGEESARLSAKLGARAFTLGNDIYFSKHRFEPASHRGRRLIAHELTHVVQQGFAPPMRGVGRGARAAGARTSPAVIQRDLAIEPQGTSPRRTLSQREIGAAIDFNQRKYTDPYSYKTIRDVIGIPQYPAVSDQDLALGVARWQEQHGVAQDGRVGVVTLMLILEELQAEGQDRDAALLRDDFQGRTGRRGRRLPDISTQHCGCEGALRDEIADSREFSRAYTQCGADPAITTGRQVERCVTRHFASQGVTTTTAGSTSSTGATSVARQPGRCGPLIEQVTRAHEQVHSVHTRELREQHGRGRAFRRAFNDASDWVADEVNARRTDVSVARWMLQVLGRICGGGGTP